MSYQGKYCGFGSRMVQGKKNILSGVRHLIIWRPPLNYLAVATYLSSGRHLLCVLIIKINEYDVGAGDLADPLYRLPSECVTIPNNDLEQMRMRSQRWP